MQTITVREYARLTTVPLQESTLDHAVVSAADFDELCALNENSAEGMVSFLHQESRTSLRLRHYVGILETTSGTCIEILPKTCEDAMNTEETTQRERRLLMRMLMAALNVPSYEGPEASIELSHTPLSEWIIRRFLLELHNLLKRGLRFGYERVAEERPFLRGSLDVRRQLIQAPQRRHLFHVRHDIFSANRPEHRLLRKALDRCASATGDVENARLAAPLRGIFADIPPSTALAADFRQWSRGRHMTHYQAVRPWCELVLGEYMPFAFAGNLRGLSMLFPMERLFEAYVTACLRRQLRLGAVLTAQTSGKWLCRLKDTPFFALQPDIRIQYKGIECILDTKWKKISGSAAHFGINQSDVYQIFAYGQKYLGGEGDMALIYPKHRGFPAQLEAAPFRFSEKLGFWALGWDLDQDYLVVPPDCALREFFMETEASLES
ncbi:MAG: McrC family protein [Desulfovibrionaceae bacterium]|nr:McrC family protein [Desulfovibrionaceae bacterium]